MPELETGLLLLLVASNIHLTWKIYDCNARIRKIEGVVVVKQKASFR